MQANQNDHFTPLNFSNFVVGAEEPFQPLQLEKVSSRTLFKLSLRSPSRLSSLRKSSALNGVIVWLVFRSHPLIMVLSYWTLSLE